MKIAKLLGWFVQHKLIVGIALLLLFGTSWVLYGKYRGSNEVVRYAIDSVKRGTVISSITGTGQVSSSNQLEVKGSAGGTVIGIEVKNAQQVKANTVLVRLDPKDAMKVVRDAQLSLMSAQLSLKKLLQPPDPLDLIQAENAVIQSRNAKERAQDDLQSARISLQKMTQDPDALALLQAQNALTSSQEARKKSEDDLKKTREDGFNDVADAFLNFPTIITGLNDMFFTSSIDHNQSNVDWYANQITKWESDKVLRYKSDLTTNYAIAREHYDTTFDHYKSSSRASDSQTLEALILETYETSKRISDAVKAASNYSDLVQNVLKTYNYPIPSIIATQKNSLTTYTNASNTSSSNLLSIKQGIENAKTSMISADRSIGDKEESLKKLQSGADPLDVQTQNIAIKQREQSVVDADRVISEKTQSLSKLKDGADPLDIQTQKLTVAQRENAFNDANEHLENYTVRALFDGEVASLNVKLGDSVSASQSLATLITQQRIAELSLNEVDVAKIKPGQKATLIFDAIPDMTISGVVFDIDTVGVVSQGVVTYTVKISFDTQDDRVKPGMSVSGTIITDVRQDVLVVPNSALKSSNGSSSVDIPLESISEAENLSAVTLKLSPRSTQVMTGSGNETFTEIVSGLKEGDMIVTKTLKPQSTATSQQQAPVLFGAGGGRRQPGR